MKLRQETSSFQKRFFLFLCIFFLCAFSGASFYLFFSYQSLKTYFHQAPHTPPLRIYSDLTHLFLGEPKRAVSARLKALRYQWHVVTADQWVLELHPILFPFFLLPEKFRPLFIPEKKLFLEFSQAQPSLLVSLTLENQTLSEFYLEPELLATVSTHSDIRSYLSFPKIPSFFWKAVIAIEDRHFLKHSGLDWHALFRALWIDLKTFSFKQGGSTITQQLVKNLLKRQSKNPLKKLHELLLSFLLEWSFSKEQILERYLNEIYLGQQGSHPVRGIFEGAKFYFQRTPSQLNIAEIALLVGLIRGPHFYSPYLHPDRAKARMRLILRKMKEEHFLFEAQYQEALQMPIRLVPFSTVQKKTPFWIDAIPYLVQKIFPHKTETELFTSGNSIYTTLDLWMQKEAQKILSQKLGAFEQKKMHQASKHASLLEGIILSCSLPSGKVRVFVGGRNYSKSKYLRLLFSTRQIGSLWKPITVLSAFEKKTDPHAIPYGPLYPLSDTPWVYRYDHQSWSPKNFHPRFQGKVTLIKALTQSLNVPFAKLGMQLGLPRLIQTARKLNIYSSLPSVPSLTLGAAELHFTELLQAYLTFALRGKVQHLSFIRAILSEDQKRILYQAPNPSPTQRFAPENTDLIQSMLEEVFISGTAKSASKLGWDRPAAGKTGTSSFGKDSWFLGWTPFFSTLVWAGSEKGKKLPFPLTGASLALPIWVSFMNSIHQGLAPQSFAPNSDLVSIAIEKTTGKPAGKNCLFEKTSFALYPHWVRSVPKTNCKHP